MTDDRVPAEERLKAIRAMHTRSAWPANRGEHRGKHYCLHCTKSVDDFVLYIDWPCPTAKFAGADHS